MPPSLHQLYSACRPTVTIGWRAKNMMRSIVGWVRVPGKDWHDTMQRMKLKLAKATETRAIRSWTETPHVRPMLVAMWKHAGNWPSNFPTKPWRDPGRPCLGKISNFATFNSKMDRHGLTRPKKKLLWKQSFLVFCRQQ